MEIDHELLKSVRECLIVVARSGEIINYSDLLERIDISSAEFSKVNDILREINVFEVSQGSPMLTAIVVIPFLDFPPELFFTQARSLGRFHGTEVNDEIDFFQEEAKRVHEYWKEH